MYDKIDSITPLKTSMIFQLGEFVMYGPVSSTNFESIATPTLATPSPSKSIYKGTAQNSKIFIEAEYQGVFDNRESQFGQPKPGDKYVQFYVTVKNIGYPNKPIGNPHFFKLFDSNNEGHSPLVPSHGEWEMTGMTNSNPRDESGGVLIFEIKQNAEPVKLTYNDYDNNLTINL